jgi:diguanylate cyclase (GGDEF)-like protein
MTVAIRDAKHVTEERELARTDELTGLPNRRKFLAELDLLLRKEGMLLILDLNGFKKVNDEFGHDVGDELLRQVAARFSRAILANALIARLGGDEFGVIIYGPPNLGRETALALRSTLTYPFSLPVGEVSVGVSIGACMNSKEIRSKEDLLRSADAAMYEAKRGALGLVEREK